MGDTIPISQTDQRYLTSWQTALHRHVW